MINCKTKFNANEDKRGDGKCSKCGAKDHKLQNCPEVVCHECNKKGHIRPNCPDKKDHSKDKVAVISDNLSSITESNDEAELAILDSESPEPDMFDVQYTVSDMVAAVITATFKRFCVDSGSTRNVCNSLSWFSSMSTENKHHLTLYGMATQPDGTNVPVPIQCEGFGVVKLKVRLGSSNEYCVLSLNCYYSPSAADNLLSTDLLKQKVNIEIPPQGNKRTHHKIKCELFYSTENNCLYNPRYDIIITLQRRNINSLPEQGSQYEMREIMQTDQDTISFVEDDLDDDENDDSANADENQDNESRFPRRIDDDQGFKTITPAKSYVAPGQNSFQTSYALNIVFFDNLLVSLNINAFDGDIIQPLLSHQNILPNKLIQAVDKAASGTYTNGNYYAHPNFTDEVISRVLQVALRSYTSSPRDTSFTLILPIWRTSSWWQILNKYFDLTITFPAGETDLMLKHISGSGKSKICKSKWAIGVFHICRSTPIKVDSSIIGHCRYNHVSASTLNKLYQSGANLGFKIKETSYILCHICNICKATRPSVLNLSNKLRSDLAEALTSLFMDIHGPINPKSSLGYRFVLGFICACTGYSFIFFLKYKSDSYMCIKEVISILENDKNLPVRFDSSKLTLSSDNAKEFKTEEIDKFCKSKKITQHFSSTYAHHENLYIERLWRTLADASRSMLSMASIQVRFWPLAWKHANQIYNFMPHRTRDDTTASDSPHFRLYKAEPDLSHIRIFGSDAYRYLERSARKGTKATASRAIFGKYVGHDMNTKTILMLDQEQAKVTRSGLVKIIENVDKIGQIISNPDVSVASYEFEKYDSHMLSRPSPFTSRKQFNKISEILEIASYYDETDRETYALIKFKSANAEPIWTPAFHLLYYMAPTFAYATRDMLISFLRTNNGPITGNTNIYYPLFAYVSIIFEDKKYMGFIVSTDAHSTSQYGTILYDSSSNSEVLHQDLSKDSVLNFNNDILLATSDVFVSALYKEPESYKEAMQLPDSSEWKEATNLECKQMFNVKKCLKSIQKYNTMIFQKVLSY